MTLSASADGLREACEDATEARRGCLNTNSVPRDDQHQSLLRDLSAGDILIADRLSASQIAELQALYQQEWWTIGRTLAETESIVANSTLNVALVDRQSSHLIGYARVLSDYTIKALILDVIVRSDYRKRKLGAALMNLIVSHPALSKVKHFELYCAPEMVAFYESWKFTADLGTLKFMRRA